MKSSKDAVLYLSRMVPYYREAALSLLNERLGGRLVVCAGTPPRSSSLQTLTPEASPGYERIPMRNVWIRGETLHIQPFGHAFEHYPRPSVVIAEESVRSVTLPFLLRHARRLGAARLLWGHFSSNHAPFSPKSLKTRYRIALARNVEGCICYSEPVANLLRPYVASDRLFVAPNTLDTGRLLHLHDGLQREGRLATRKRLSLPAYAPVIAFLGRLIASKGVHQLLSVFEILLRRHPKAMLIVIGDGPERAVMEDRIKTLGHVKMLGAITSWSASAPYLYASDVLLNPGYLGLSINHAFALGLPVISQRSPSPNVRYHSPEIDYLQPKSNGLLSPHGDLSAMADAVETILRDQEQYAQNALSFARNHLGLEKMVDGLVHAVTHVEKSRA